MSAPEELALISGHTYSAKRPAKVGAFDPLINDRQIVWISGDGARVQYDSPSVRVGQRRPMISREEFLKWAKADITDQMPEGDWRRP